MSIECSYCRSESGHWLDRDRIRLATAVGAISAFVVRRKVRSAMVGSVIGWAVGRMWRGRRRCPSCGRETGIVAHTVEFSKSDDSKKSTDEG